MSYQRANTHWMDANFGLSVHWTSHSSRLDQTQRPYQEAVELFDVERFADTLASVNAKHCIFTLTHAKEYLAMPNAALDRLLPGRTSQRDLVGEIIQALKKRDIRFIAYYNHSCNNNDDPQWKNSCGYAAGQNGNLDAFAQNICDIVSEISNRYGKDLCGWWFDSGYSVDRRGPHDRVTCDMGDWRFPWEKLTAAAKSGNANSAVAINAGVAQTYLYSECQDYYAGEATKLDTEFMPPVIPDLHDHRWICLDSPAWVFGTQLAQNGFAGPQFQDEPLKAYIQEHLNAKRMLTFNVLIDQEGFINPKAIEQLKRLNI